MLYKAGSCQNKAPAQQQDMWGIPPFSAWDSEWRCTCEHGKGPRFKLLLNSVCQSWCWKEPSVAIVCLWGACAAPKQPSSDCGTGLSKSGWPWSVGAGGKLASHRAKLGKGSFHLLLFLLLQHDAGLAGVCLQPSSVSVCSTSAVQKLWCG